MGFCKICRQHMSDPFDCDCRCPNHGEDRDVLMPCAECEEADQ